MKCILPNKRIKEAQVNLFASLEAKIAGGRYTGYMNDRKAFWLCRIEKIIEFLVTVRTLLEIVLCI